MKKLITLLFVIALSLSLCSCGKQEDKSLSDSTAPVYNTQEITLDNWNTYFEVIEEENWSINGFGEAEDYKYNYLFKVREDYLHKINTENFNLSIEFAFTANYHDATVNLETQEVNIGEVVTNISGDDTGEVKRVYDITDMNDANLIPNRSISTYLIQWDNGSQSMYVIEDAPVITRIQGSIQLLEE